MSNPNLNRVEPFTVDLYDLDMHNRFSSFIDDWRAELAREGNKRVFDFGVLPVLPVPVKVEEKDLIKIELAANGEKLGVFITPNSLYTVAFVRQRDEDVKYALFKKSKHLLPNSKNVKPVLLNDESYDKMGGFIDGHLDRDGLAHKLMHAIHGLANHEREEIDDLGKKMGVIVQVIIEPIRFSTLQQQYTSFFSPNERQPALKTPIYLSEDKEGGSGQNDRVAPEPVETQANSSDG